MPKLIIDGQEIAVPEGTKVIEAAERLGIMIPRFCYHPALGAVGACRVCAVKFVEGPHKGIDMSCMVEARDGMVVSTTDEEAVQFRKYVIEWLMLNHPLDCPVCDEGGHCLLQDETVSGGHGVRRYPGKKRTYLDQDLGPFVRHEMNRCIHCFRCRRFYQDFAGYRDLGALQIGRREYFGRFQSGPLESPFSGNLIDICPTGVYTDKPARFKGRRWNFERGPSLCIHCSLGCNTTGSARYREIVRQEARINEAINGHFICDRGRFGFDFANHPDRIRQALVEHKPAVWEQAVNGAADALKKIHQERGADSILCVGSSRCSLESQVALRRLCRLLGWPEPKYFIESELERKIRTAASRLDESVAASMGEVKEADFILSLGTDPVNESPMLALAMRQARRNDAAVIVADPRPVFLPFDFSHFPMAPRAVDSFAGALVREALKEREPEKLQGKAKGFYDSLPAGFTPDPDLEAEIRNLGRRLAGSRKPVIICGTDVVGKNTVAFASDLAHLLREDMKGARLFYVLPGANAFGAGLLSPAGRTDSVLESIESGRVKTLVLVEQDPFWLFPDRDRLEEALERLEYLLLLDYLPSESEKRAHAVLPTTTLFERTPVTFVNQEGRMQKVFPIHRGGEPLSQVSGGKHPPRTFLDRAPGSIPKAAHEVLAELYTAISGRDAAVLLDNIEEDAGCLSGAARLLSREPSEDTFSSEPAPPYSERDGMELLPVDRTFGTEELSCYSRFTVKAESNPRFQMHPDDAARLGLAEGDRIAISLNGGELSLELALAPTMAAGAVIIPRHRQARWQKINQVPCVITDQQIRKL
jgi:NADH-quinone oxidoreductase subunit G